jgi:hypothetical protein
MARDVDSDLLHSRNCLLPNSAGFDASALDFKLVASVMTENAFCHLATRRISRAEDQYAFSVFNSIMSCFNSPIVWQALIDSALIRSFSRSPSFVKTAGNGTSET